MTLKFRGKPATYAKIIKSISRHQYWSDRENDCVRCDLDRGVVVHWWMNTGTVLFQGPPTAAASLKAKFFVLAGAAAVFVD
jgi:hypothetical protein